MASSTSKFIETTLSRPATRAQAEWENARFLRERKAARAAGLRRQAGGGRNPVGAILTRLRGSARNLPT